MRAGWVGATTMIAAATAGLAGQPVFRSGVDLVSFGVTVVDRSGALVTDLVQDDFEIYEEGRKQTIVAFARGDATDAFLPPLHLGLLFDTSGSMEKDAKFSQSAAVKFLNTLTRAVDVTLVDFDTEVRVARYAQAEYARLIERIRMRKADGWTALYDALGVYLDGAAAQEGRKILVVYTDGGDTRSALSYSEAIDLLKASDVTLYAVGFLENQGASGRMDLKLRLRQLAGVTGGEAFFPVSIKELDPVYDKVVAEIAAQYSLGFQSTDLRADGAWRDVEIRLRRPDLKKAKIRTRAGYFAPYRGSPRN